MQGHQQRSVAGWFEHSLLPAHKWITQLVTLYRCCVRHGTGLLTEHVTAKQVKDHKQVQAPTMPPAGSRRSCKQVWQIGEEGSVSNCDKLSTYK